MQVSVWWACGRCGCHVFAHFEVFYFALCRPDLQKLPTELQTQLLLRATANGTLQELMRVDTGSAQLVCEHLWRAARGVVTAEQYATSTGSAKSVELMAQVSEHAIAMVLMDVID